MHLVTLQMLANFLFQVIGKKNLISLKGHHICSNRWLLVYSFLLSLWIKEASKLCLSLSYFAGKRLNKFQYHHIFLGSPPISPLENSHWGKLVYKGCKYFSFLICVQNLKVMSENELGSEDLNLEI